MGGATVVRAAWNGEPADRQSPIWPAEWSLLVWVVRYSDRYDIGPFLPQGPGKKGSEIKLMGRSEIGFGTWTPLLGATSRQNAVHTAGEAKSLKEELFQSRREFTGR